MRTACRTFTLQDALILMAGIALSIWIGRGRLVALSAAEAWEKGRQGRHHDALLSGLVAVREFQPGVAVLTLVVLGLRLRHPRPALRRLARQPGFMAGCAAALVIVVRGLFIAADLGLHSRRPLPPIDVYLHRALDYNEADIGYAVAAAWLVLALNRRWRRERSWIDQLGLLLGLFWVGRILVVNVPILLWK
jgi:hypothetical protein